MSRSKKAKQKKNMSMTDVVDYIITGYKNNEKIMELAISIDAPTLFQTVSSNDIATKNDFSIMRIMNTIEEEYDVIASVSEVFGTTDELVNQ